MYQEISSYRTGRVPNFKYTHCVTELSVWVITRTVTDQRIAPVTLTMNASEEVDVVIVGGGVSGLSAAYKLLKNDPNIDVVVLEAKGKAL